MGQRQRGGDGDAAGSRGAAVPTSPCPRGAELRGGDVQGPANLKPVPKSCFYCGVTIKRVLAGCCPRARSLLTVAVGCREALGGSTRPHGDPQHRGAQGELSWGPWDPPGAVGSPFWGHGTPFLGPWVVVFLGSQPLCSQRRVGAAPAPALRIWGDPQEGLCTPKKSPERRYPPHGGAVGGAEGAGPAGWGAQGASGAPLARAEPRCPAPAAVPTGPPITRLLPNRT